ALKNQTTDAMGHIMDGTPSLTVTTRVQGVSAMPPLAGVNEVQRVTVKDATGGTFTLSFNGFTTDPIPFNASPGDVAKALAAPPDLAPPTHAWTITFIGGHRRQDVPLITLNTGGLFNNDGSLPKAGVEELVQGSATADEVQVIQANATGGTFTVSFN